MKTKIIFIFIALFWFGTTEAADFEFRLKAVDCNTAQLQVRCTNPLVTPSIGQDLADFTVFLRSPEDIEFDNPTFHKGFSGTLSYYAHLNGQETWVMSLNDAFVIGSGDEWTTNVWESIATFEVVGSTYFFLANGQFNPDNTDPYMHVNGVSWTFDIAPMDGAFIKQWVGGASGFENLWSNANNWCPASVPTASEDILIPNRTYFPELTAHTTINSIIIDSNAYLDLHGYNLTVEEGILAYGIIKGSANSNLTVNGTMASIITMDSSIQDTSNILANLTLNNSGGLTLRDTLVIKGILTLNQGVLHSNGNLRLFATAMNQYAQIAPTGSGSINGLLSYEKVMRDTLAGWRYISRPLQGTHKGFSGIRLLDSFHQSKAERNIKWWNGRDKGGNVAYGWQDVNDTTMLNFHAYMIYTNNRNVGKHELSKKIRYTGTYNNADVSIQLFGNTQDPNPGAATDEARGWYFVGNPYPSNIDINALFATWNANGNPVYKGVHLWDPVNNQYKAYLDGISIQDYNGPTQIGADSNLIPPFQAFWVKAGSGENSFTIPNSSRTTNMNNVLYLQKNITDLLRLNVINASNKWDQTVVYFDELGTENHDVSLEAYKLLSNDAEVPSLYALTQGAKFAISAVSSTQSEHRIPLGFGSKVTGSTRFELNSDFLDTKWRVYLEDKELGIYYDIRNTPYDFNHHLDAAEGRFVLLIQPYPMSNEKLISNLGKMNITGNGEDVFVYFPSVYNEQLVTVEVTDMMGKEITKRQVFLKGGMNTLENFNVVPGYYSIRVYAKEEISNGKVQIGR